MRVPTPVKSLQSTASTSTACHFRHNRCFRGDGRFPVSGISNGAGSTSRVALMLP